MGPLGADFAPGAHYFGYASERLIAEHLGDDVRALDAVLDDAGGLGNPAAIIRVDGNDSGSYADLKKLEPRAEADLPRLVEKRLRESFAQDRRIAVVVVDGREAGLTIDGAVRGIRRVLAFWRAGGQVVRAEQRMVVVTGDGGSVVWRGDSGAINVSA